MRGPLIPILSRRAGIVTGLTLAGLMLVSTPQVIGDRSLSSAVPPVSAQVRLDPVGPQPLATAPLPPTVTAKAAAVIDATTGAPVFEKNARAKLPPASITKIATAWLVLQRLDLKEVVTVQLTPGELDPDSQVVGLVNGEQATVEDLLYGMILHSGNDAALVLARQVGGTEPAFTDALNRSLRQAGVMDSNFVNSHGLDAPGHFTTAFDIAQIARLAMADPRFNKIVATDLWEAHGAETYRILNRNPFLKSYPGADGVKIGWTEGAGQTIVASATHNGRRLIVALLDTNDRVADSSALLDWAFSSFVWDQPR